VDPEVQKKALKGYPRGEEPFDGRPADILEPELDKAKKDVEDLAKDIDDVLIYALYPTTGKRFLKWKYGHEEMPDEVKNPRTLEEGQKIVDLIEKAKKGLVVEKSEEAPAKGDDVRTFNVFVDGEYYKVEVEQVGGQPVVSSIAPAGPQPAQQPAQPAQPAAQQQPAKPQASEAPKAAPASGTTVEAPMPGMIIRFEVKEGDEVSEGDPLLILEAMKMENSINAPTSGTVKEIRFKEGESVKKGDVMVVIG
jgi:pyruvate carboxylase subunit B